MSKRKEYQVSLNLLGSLDENLHVGSFSSNWWEAQQTNNVSDTDTNISNLYPICVNMKTATILQDTEFTLTIVQGNKSSFQQLGYICKAKGKKSTVFDNSSPAISTLYQELFGSKTKFSRPLIMGHNKLEINEQLLKNIHFHPFNCKLEKFQLFVYGIGISSDKQLHNTGPVWQKINKFKEYKGIDLFGITHSQVQSLIQTMCVPKCQPEEWGDADKTEALKKNSIIEITDTLKNLHSQNHVLNDREMKAW
nr:12_t:CDS:2 [Entrophospora candida]